MRATWTPNSLTLTCLLLAGVAMTSPAEDPPALPPTRTQDLVEPVHGTPVADPYRWLEDGNSTEVRQWADAQDAHTRARLDAFPSRARIRARIEQLSSIGRVMSPLIRKQRVFFLRRSALQNQPVLYVRDGFAGPARVVLDPNSFSSDATVAMDWWSPDDDGRLLAYGVSEGGSEISTLKVLDIDTGKHLPDQIPFCRATSPSWLADATGFYYSRYPAPGTVPPGEEKYHRQCYFHRLGTDPTLDPLVFGADRAKEDWPDVSVSHDDRWLLASVFQGWSRSELFLKERSREDAPWIPVLTGREATASGQFVGGKLYLRTDLDAPRGRIVRVDPAQPDPAHWQELIPEGAGTLQNFDIVGDRLILEELRQASSRLRVHDLEGKPLGDIPLPTLGSVGGGGGEWDGTDYVFSFESYFTPPALFRYETPTGRLSVWEKVDSDIVAEAFESRQVTYVSRDGTPVSMFLVHRKGLKADGTHPVLLYGYGGFNISMTPGFSGSLVMWLEAGGVYAVANLRGGGEYGEAWHKAGMLEHKQNVFDDFAAAAEWLIRERIAAPDRLAISGGSNGGLLVGAALTQRPDLFRAVVCAVPLLDMVRYHRFQIARLWIPEYGTADDPAQFPVLFGYSPYHRVRDGVGYPAVLLMTADTDTRVDPLHARKMAARLQAAQSAANRPILLRVEKKAGHGAGKPLSKAIEEATDQYSFLMEQLGMSPAK